jgi:hypothetical protein
MLKRLLEDSSTTALPEPLPAAGARAGGVPGTGASR